MKLKAFTLAEVLLTIGMIGIIAAMTLPSLIKKHEERVTVNKVKVAYSLISQAYFRAMEENGGDISTWECYGNTTEKGGLCVMEKFEKYLNVISSKRDGSDSIPFSLNMETDISIHHKNLHSLTLANGFIIKFPKYGSKCNTYATWKNVAEIEKFACDVYVDINGTKRPNALGRDIFIFKLHKNTVSPRGNITEPYYGFPGQCTITTNNEFWDGGVNGVACTGWIITNENMDYLHCTGLSYKGKSKCK